MNIKEKIIAHLFQTNNGVEFTICNSNDNVDFISEDIYKGSWILVGHEAEQHLATLLKRIAHAPRPSEQASRLVRLMDNDFSREVTH